MKAHKHFESELKKYVIEKKGGHGLYRLYLQDYSERWKWWSIALYTGRLPADPYPEIEFEPGLTTSHAAYQMIERLLEPFHEKRLAFLNLLDHLLFHFGDPSVTDISKIPEEQKRHFRNTIDLRTFFKFPGDLWGHYLENNMSKWERQDSAFFTTPDYICKMMADITIPDSPNNRYLSFNDPCSGTMRMGLYASNKGILDISAQEIHPTIYKVGLINAWLYLPPSVMPSKEINKFIKEERKRLNI